MTVIYSLNVIQGLDISFVHSKTILQSYKSASKNRPLFLSEKPESFRDLRLFSTSRLYHILQILFFGTLLLILSLETLLLNLTSLDLAFELVASQSLGIRDKSQAKQSL